MNRFLFACALGVCVLPILVSSTAYAANTSLSISDARLVEPPSGQKSMIFPVNLSRAWSTDVRVQYATSVGPNASTADSTTLASPGYDFSARQGTLTIPAGTTSAQIEVPILADGEVERDETFSVTLSNVQGYNNTDTTADDVVLGRSVAKGTIIEPVKGVKLGGQVSAYIVTPSQYSNYDPTTGQYVDKFDMPAQQVLEKGVSVTITGSTFLRQVTTDAQGKFSVLVLPGSYSIQLGDFSRQNSNGTSSTYSQPGRTVNVVRDSLANNFSFYGIAGTVGVSTTSKTSPISPAYVTVEARPVGADPSSAPVSSDVADDSDTAKPTRGYRFFIPALAPGRYTLAISSAYSDGDDYYNQYYNFPSITVTLPVTTGANRPVARVQIVGTPKASSSTSSRKSASAGGS